VRERERERERERKRKRERGDKQDIKQNRLDYFCIGGKSQDCIHQYLKIRNMKIFKSSGLGQATNA
jgi:hypothetical protein